MKTAFLFPGQGAQKVGMGLDFFESYPEAKEVFNAADDSLGEKLKNLIFEGPTEDLTLTENTQPAIVTMSIAALRSFQSVANVKPSFVAGHSLGEFSALVASGALSFSDAVRITRARGTFMQKAVPTGQGAMAAVMGQTPEEIKAACEQSSDAGVVSPANYNSPVQTVISGSTEGVAKASRILSEAGAKVIPLKVSAPFHCALMAPAATSLHDTLSGIEFHNPAPAVVTNVEARPNTDSSRISELLVQQVTAPVRWTESMSYMISEGVDLFLEFGPGNVLAGLAKRIDRSTRVISVNSKAGLDKAMEALGQK